MTPCQLLVTFALFISVLTYASALPLQSRLSQSHHQFSLSGSFGLKPFTRSETVFGIAKGLARHQARRTLLPRPPQFTAAQIIGHDLVSTQFRSTDTTFNLSINGGIWGYNQKPGYYRFVNGTVSDGTSIVNIGNDIALLEPNELTDHIVESIEGLNNLTYPYLGVKVCGEAASLRQVLNPIRSNDSMTVAISNTPTGVGMTLNTGAPLVPRSNESSVAASAIAFITIVNNAIIRRISELGWIDYVDALVTEIYLALGHRITEQVQRLVDGDCLAPENVSAGINTLSEGFKSLSGSRNDGESLEEL